MATPCPSVFLDPEYPDKQYKRLGKTCILCGDSSYYHYHKTHAGKSAVQWSTWKTDCGQSMCSLLSLSVNSFGQFLGQGPYCQQCSTNVWDIHLTLVQIRTLGERLGRLKRSVENKIRTGSAQFQDGKHGRVLQQMVKELEHQNNKKGSNVLTVKMAKITQVIKEANHEDKDNMHINNEDEDDLQPIPSPIDIGDDSNDLNSELPQKGTKMEDAEYFPEVEQLSDDSEAGLSKRKKKTPKTTNCRNKYGNKVGIIKHGSKPKAPPPVPTECALCSLAFSSKLGLKQHMAKEHPDRVFACTQCLFHYRSAEGLETHMKNAHGGKFPFYCPTCRQGLNTEEELSAHEVAHSSTDNPFTCANCQMVFTNSIDLELHVLTHVNPFHCTKPDCGKSFATQKMLDRHVGFHTRSVICDVCGSSWCSQGHLKSHMRIHSQEKNFRCHLCPAAYKIKLGLTRHMRKHTGERPYACRICGRAFADPGHRKIHEQIHSGLKPHVCHICGKAFSTRPYLRQHSNETHGGRRRGPSWVLEKKIRKKQKTEEVDTAISTSLTSQAIDSISNN